MTTTLTPELGSNKAEVAMKKHQAITGFVAAVLLAAACWFSVLPICLH